MPAGAVLSAESPSSVVGSRPTSSRNCSSALSSASICACAALTRDLPTCAKYRGATKPASNPMMTITTSSSRRVNPKLRRLRVAPCVVVSMVPSRLRVPQRALSRPVGIYRSSARPRLSQQRAVDAQYRGHVMPRLRERRNAVAVAVHRVLTGVVGGQCQLQVVTITCQEIAKLIPARRDVLFRVEGIGYPVTPGGARQQLHQTHRPAAGDRVRVEGR